MLREIGSDRIKNMPASPTVAMNMKASEMISSGIKVINLAGGEPDFDTPKVIVEEAKKSLDAGRTHYAIGTGIKDLRTVIAKKMQEENLIDVSADNIILTPGAKFALYMAFQALINPGDEVLLVTPNWVSYAPIISAAGGVVVEVEVTEDNDYKVTKEQLLKLTTDETKVLLYCSPCNPTGHIIDKEEAEEIADYLEETGVYCVADEIYERISFGKVPCSVGSIDKVKDQVITVMGFSKGYAMTGWRLGWLYVPDGIYKLFRTLYTQTITCTATFVQDGAVKAFGCVDEIKMMVDSYKERGEKFIGLLNQIDGVSASVPEGAFYAWVKFDKNNMSATEICDYLLEEAHVAGVAGIAFGDTENKHIRYAFAQAEEELIEAANRIKKAMDKL